MGSNNDPMEEFLNREKAALEALEAVEINNSSSLNDNAMDIDQFGTPVTAISPHTSPTIPSHSPTPSSPKNTFSSPKLNVQSSTVFNHSPKMSIPTGQASFKSRTETSAMKEWKSKQTARIAQAEADAEHLRQKRQDNAREDIESFMRDWKAGVEERQRMNRESEDHVNRNVGGCIWDQEEAANDAENIAVKWKDVLGLIEVLPKPAKDCSRLLGIIKTL